MSPRYVEVRQVAEAHGLSLDLARHLACRLLVGRVTILARPPSVFAATLGKRWTGVLRDMEREYAKTLNSVRRRELARELRLMKSAVFSSRPPLKPSSAHVLVVSSIAHLPSDCPTIYTVRELSQGKLRQILMMLPAEGVVVMYGAWNEAYQAMLKDLR
jgi:hypothetical protein